MPVITPPASYVRITVDTTPLIFTTVLAPTAVVEGEPIVVVLLANKSLAAITAAFQPPGGSPVNVGVSLVDLQTVTIEVPTTLQTPGISTLTVVGIDTAGNEGTYSLTVGISAVSSAPTLLVEVSKEPAFYVEVLRRGT